MHPRCRQVPPTLSRSTIAIFSPRSAARARTRNPPGPRRGRRVVARHRVLVRVIVLVSAMKKDECTHAGQGSSWPGASLGLRYSDQAKELQEAFAVSEFRTEKDSMGDVQVPAHGYWGASTQRAVENFPISGQTFPPRFIRALALIKGAAAEVNAELGLLDDATSPG